MWQPAVNRLFQSDLALARIALGAGWRVSGDLAEWSHLSPAVAAGIAASPIASDLQVWPIATDLA